MATLACRRSLLSASSTRSSHVSINSLHPSHASSRSPAITLTWLSTSSATSLCSCSSLTHTSFIQSLSSRSFATASTAQSISFELKEAIALVRATAPQRFDETVEIAINLGVDPRKPNQSVRGAAMLPHGSGKTVRIAVFAKGDKAEEARKAGADIVGEADLAAKIQEGKIDFQRCISTPDMMGVVGRVARILGPRGLMPNPKLGTVTTNVADAIRNAKKGQVEFRTEKAGIVQAPMGKLSFSDTSLYENIESFVKTIIDAKPSGAKGIFIRKCTLSSTQGKGVPVDIRVHPFKVARTRDAATNVTTNTTPTQTPTSSAQPITTTTTATPATSSSPSSTANA